MIKILSYNNNHKKSKFTMYPNQKLEGKNIEVCILFDSEKRILKVNFTKILTQILILTNILYSVFYFDSCLSCHKIINKIEIVNVAICKR